jgi:hypothetical protein
MRTMRLVLMAALVLTAIVAFGCGGDSDRDEIESVLRRYIDHYVKSEPEQMYPLLDAASRRNCSEENFAGFISRAREALGEREFKVVRVRDVVINGDTATATVESTVDGEAADPTENTLIKEGSAWRLQLPSTVC